MDGQPDFFLSQFWIGIRIGYEFKRGPKGLGYYLTKKQDKNIVNPLVSKQKKRKSSVLASAWAQGSKETKSAKEAQDGVGGREGRSIEDRLNNAGLLTEVQAVEEGKKALALKQAAQKEVLSAKAGSLVHYVPSDEWKGVKIGYAFKLGEKGQGYYLDDEKAAESVSTALVVIPQEEQKMNNFKYQLAIRGGGTQNELGEIVYPYDAIEAARQMERLSAPGNKFMNLNPFHVLELEQEHDIAQLKEAYGKLAALMDPEKNSDARAIPLQDVAMKAFRTLANPDKRDRCMETYVLAQDQVEYAWKKENKERAAIGDEPVPYILNPERGTIHYPDGREEEEPIKYSPAFHERKTKMVFKLMAELDERFKRAEATWERNKEESKLKAAQSQAKKAKHEEWENEREDRVGGWRLFNKGKKKKKKRLGAGTTLWSKPEQRSETQQLKDADARRANEEGSGGANNTYKQTWR